MSVPPSYDAQHRGTAGAYEAYFAGMDRTMRQKLAFVGAHFLLDPGARIADMGCGSGSGTYQLALLNPDIEVIGVDINPESVRFATEKYRLPNLRFIVGDAAEPVFADDPLDGILSSSTLHHVYTFNGYSRAAVRRAIASHLACLRENGVFVLRDFVSPPRDAYILLELPDRRAGAMRSPICPTRTCWSGSRTRRGRWTRTTVPDSFSKSSMRAWPEPGCSACRTNGRPSSCCARTIAVIGTSSCWRSTATSRQTSSWRSSTRRAAACSARSRIGIPGSSGIASRASFGSSTKAAISSAGHRPILSPSPSA